MKLARTLLLLTASFFTFLCRQSQAQGPDVPCVTDAYPPDPSLQVKTYTVDLDKDPKERWVQISSDYKAGINALVAHVKNMFTFIDNGTFIPVLERDLAPLVDKLPHPYGDEIKGISTTLGSPVTDILLYNIFYEIFTLCTSIVGQDKNSALYHARNLDFGLLMGWDVRNDTWIISEMLRPMVVNVNYVKGGSVMFKAVHFAGYIGVLSGVKPGVFTLTMNERFSLDGGYIGILEWLLGMRSESWMGFLTRGTLESATSFSEAVDKLANTPMLAPAYFIVGGIENGEGTVITRAREKALDIWKLNPANGTWYILETNYDHWQAPLFIDDRRTPANKCMKQMDQGGMSLPGLYNVLSTRPVLNKLTTYTTLIRVDGHLETYRRSCPDPCWPF